MESSPDERKYTDMNWEMKKQRFEQLEIIDDHWSRCIVEFLKAMVEYWYLEKRKQFVFYPGDGQNIQKFEVKASELYGGQKWKDFFRHIEVLEEH